MQQKISQYDDPETLAECNKSPTMIYESIHSSNTNGIIFTSRVLYDRGKFKFEQRYSYDKNINKAHHSFIAESDTITYFDKTAPYILWGYDAKTKTAVPGYGSCEYFFKLMSRKLGKQKIMDRHHIPNTPHNQKIILQKFERLGNPFVFRGATPSQFVASENKQYIYKGTEDVAGHKCDVYETDPTDNPRNSIHSIQRIYVDSITHFILRSDLEISPDPRKPTIKNTSMSSLPSFKILKSIPENEFQLPPGTKVILPQIMKDIPLPRGIIRNIMTGKYKEVGFSIEEMFAISNTPDSRFSIKK
jgi:hypothetical protein